MTATTSRAQPRIATAALVGVTAIWGSTFVVVKDAVERMPVMDFLALRFLLAALVMLLLQPLALSRLGREGLRHGVLLGIPLGVGYVGQTIGLQYTSAAVSGFITGMFVVFTPLIAAVVLRRPVGAAAWGAVALATTGLALISLRGWSIGPGELLTLLCAFCFAIHIIGLGEWSALHDSYALAIVQLITVAALCGAAALPGGFTAPPDATAWLAVVVTAVFATALAFVVQTWAQSLLTPTRAAVIMTMEPVFAGLVAAMTGESLQQRTIVGGALVVAAMYLIEVGPRRGAEGRQERLEI